MNPSHVVTAVVTAIATALVARALLPPTPRLAARVRPYTVLSRSRLGAAPDLYELGAAPRGHGGDRLVDTPLRRLVAWLGRLADSSSEEMLLLRLRQADVLGDVPESSRVQAYRMRLVGSATVTAAVFTVLALATGQAAATVLLLATLGTVSGLSRTRGRLDRAIEQRRLRMQIELYTVNQLLAMCVRAGGGVVQAITRVVERGHGAVVDELGEVLAAHRGGRRVAQALEQVAQTTPEPQAARTYRLLARGAEFGTDLAEGLRALSEDIRDQRLEALKRAATKRRAAMLVPIIAILAPVMLLFVAAPLPSIVFGGR